MIGNSQRRITLCADDYGISEGVNRAIRDLIAQGRLNATSVMVVGPAIGRDQLDALQAVARNSPRCRIGLHATLTAPFHPLTLGFRPLRDGLFPPLPNMLRGSLLRLLDAEMIRAEIAAQIAAFRSLFGRAPDYVDGHQHVQLFPQIRDGVCEAMATHAPGAWLRQGGRTGSFTARLASPKGLLLDALSAGLRRRADRAGIATNVAFAGAYDFTRDADFAALMQDFLIGLPDGGLVMVHPGFVDDTLRALDPFTDQRRREYDYLCSDAFAALLDAQNVTLS